jgi:hypothetical protein
MQRALFQTSEIAQRELSLLGLIGVRVARSKAPILNGKLRASIHRIVEGEKVGEMSLSIRSDHPGAGPQEEGGIIRSRGRDMTVPIGHRIQGGPRHDPYKLFRIRARDGRVFLATRLARKLVLRWILVRQVKLKGHHFLQAGQDEVSKRLGERLLDAMEQEILHGD